MAEPGTYATTAPPAWLTPGAIGLAAVILSSYRRVFGRPLVAGMGDQGSSAKLAEPPLGSLAVESLADSGTAQGALRIQAQELFRCDTVVLAHDGSPDPRLTYANAAALSLWGRPWDAMVGMPSRLTAEPEERASRAAALATALRQDAIAGYGGVRIDSRGRRFQIANARLWTLRDSQDQPCGQAAAFSSWWWL